MSGRSTRFCPWGHDKELPNGKTTTGRCRVCNTLSQRARRERLAMPPIPIPHLQACNITDCDLCFDLMADAV